MYRDVYMQRKNVYIVIKHTDIMSDNSFMWFKQTWFSTMDNWDHYSTFDFSIGKSLKQTGYLVPYMDI